MNLLIYGAQAIALGAYKAIKELITKQVVKRNKKIIIDEEKD